MAEEFDLDRFLEAQEVNFEDALAELAAGRKRSHWMWYVFPQLRGLGQSRTSFVFGLEGAAEAEAYLLHPVLGPRLLQAARLILRHEGREAAAILGPVDAQKLASCATLFAALPGAPPEFERLLEAFHGGAPCPRSRAMLAQEEAGG